MTGNFVAIIVFFKFKLCFKYICLFLLLSLLDKVNELEKAFEIAVEVHAFENSLLRKEVERLREKDKANQKVIVDLFDQLKEAKYNLQVFKAIFENEPNIEERFFDIDGFLPDLGRTIEPVQKKEPVEIDLNTKMSADEIADAKKICCIYCGFGHVVKNGQGRLLCRSKECGKTFPQAMLKNV